MFFRKRNGEEEIISFIEDKMNIKYIKGTNQDWKNAIEIDVNNEDLGSTGKWVWYEFTEDGLFDDRPFDGMISTDINFQSTPSKAAIGTFKVHDPDHIIKYVRVLINDKVILLKGNWIDNKEYVVKINNLQAGTNFIVIEFKMKKRYPLSKIILGTLKQPAISAQIEVEVDNQTSKPLKLNIS